MKMQRKAFGTVLSPKHLYSRTTDTKKYTPSVSTPDRLMTTYCPSLGSTVLRSCLSLLFYNVMLFSLIPMKAGKITLLKERGWQIYVHTHIRNCHPGPFHFKVGKTNSNSPLKGSVNSLDIIRLFYRLGHVCQSETGIMSSWERDTAFLSNHFPRFWMAMEFRICPLPL